MCRKLRGKIRLQSLFRVRRVLQTAPFFLAALSEGPCLLKGVLFSDDSRAVLSCLEDLGFELEIREAAREVRIVGTGGRIPRPDARLNVRSAGTAARFLTVFLAFAGGDYQMDASSQMKKRPMRPLFEALTSMGAEFTFFRKTGTSSGTG